MFSSLRDIMTRASITGDIDRRAYADQEAALWQQLNERGRALDMSPIGVTTKAHLDLDKVSGRFLAAGASSLLLHDVASFRDSERRDEVMACAELPGRNPMVTGLNWYPHDTGMLTASLASGKLMAWDTAHLQVIELLDTKTLIACHALCPESASASVALGTDSGIELFDLAFNKRQLLIRSPSRISSLAWDVHRSGMVLTGSASGQLCQWDLRQPNTALFTAQGPHLIDRLMPIPGYEGNLPSCIVSGYDQVYLWSMMDACFTRISPAGRRAFALDFVPTLDILILGMDGEEEPELLVDGQFIGSILGMNSIVANPFIREIYVYEDAHEKLRCFGR